MDHGARECDHDTASSNPAGRHTAVTPPVVTPPPVTPPTTGATNWSSSAVYTAGMTATENGVTYKANWWVQGVDPAQHSGVGDSGEAWTIIAGGSNDPTPWLATKVYTAGLEVSENGVIYKANWWVQGVDPAHNNGANGPVSLGRS